MSRYDLAAMVRMRKPRKRRFVLRRIQAPGTYASDLYATAYRPIVDTWAKAAERVIAEYERNLSELKTDSPADIEAAIAATENELQRLVVTLRPSLQRLLLRVEAWTRGKWRGAVLSATGVDVGTMIGPQDARTTLEGAIASNVSLVRSVSDQARERIAGAVFRGLNQRKPAADVAKEIREAVAMSRRRSLNIASDQIVKISEALVTERRREAGIDKWEWQHSGKLHAREEHQARDGNEYSDDNPPEDMPAELPFCGCTSLAVIDLDA